MNPFYRVIAQSLSSPSATNKTPSLIRFSSSSLYSTSSKHLSQLPNSSRENDAVVDWPKPSEIPFQPKVANSINLIGCIHIPIQYESTPDGGFWARTVLTRPFARSRPFRVPITFTGDLAHIAVSHLKANDYVYVKGELSADPPPQGLDGTAGESHFQVMVHSINFVEESPQLRKKRIASNHDTAMSGPGR